MDDQTQGLTRDERQALCVRRWLENKGKGIVCAATGFGKTNVAMLVIQKLLTIKPDLSILVVVPSQPLKEQWEGILSYNGICFNVEVSIINTASQTPKKVDLLIVDEIHTALAKTFINLFRVVKYRHILGLTATIERLDKRETLINSICPVVDRVTLSDCIINHWASDFVEYKVILNVENIEEYKQLEYSFQRSFEFFNYNFDLAMKMSGKDGFDNKKLYANALCPKRVAESERAYNMRYKEVLKQVNFHAHNFQRTMQARKTFIFNHSKKVEVARKIIEARSNCKIITFSGNIKMAESIGIGDVYSGKDSKKHGKEKLEKFINSDVGVLNSIARLDAGLDCKGLSVGIVLGLNSSEIKSQQRTGRVVRKENNKFAEMFTLVINDTKELTWYDNSHKNMSYITIDEDNLMKVLNHEPFETYKKPVEHYNFRF